MNKILLFIFLFLVVNGNAQAPQAIPYQAVARDNTGILIANQTVSLRFSIHNATASGTIVYRETQSATTNEFGLFIVNIGMGTPVSGTFSTIDWGGGAKFIQVELDFTGGSTYVDMGTQQMLSVPYSLYSKTSENGMPSGTSNGQILYWNGTSWVSTTGGSNGQTLVYCNGIPTWGECIPVLTTTAVSSISNTTASSGGNISNDAGTPVTARGVCWSISANPTTSDSKTIDGTGIGTFTSSITGLTANSPYHVRAYATNSVGTAYGNDVVFTTISFPTVTICSQIWMLKNLDVDKYNNGDPIPRVTDPAVWASLTTGAYCYYFNDSATWGPYAGKLYNWYALNDPRGLAPTGFHVASDAEWLSLETCLGGWSVAGGKMKEIGNTHWQIPNTCATNSSGFTGLPGGTRMGNGTYDLNGDFGFFWGSTEYNTANAWWRSLLNGNCYFGRSNYPKQAGLSIRCLKD